MNEYYVGQRVRLTGWQWGDEHGDGQDWIGTLATVVSIQGVVEISPDREEESDGSYGVVEGWEVEPV